jgi:hypothetical protein
VRKKFIIAAMVLTVIFTLAACQATDVVAKVSVTSFEAVVNKLGDKVAFDQANNAWAITSPTGERFLLGKDFSGNLDTRHELDAQPFLNAGLDPAKLPADVYTYDKNANKLMVNGELGSDKFNYNGEPTIIDTYKELLRTHRASIGYHEKLDHYGIAMGNGNMLEWAKDMSKNDKDLVFVLNPEPFIKAGVDPTKVEGWIFTKVETKDANGKTIQVDKFLKPFNLD